MEQVARRRDVCVTGMAEAGVAAQPIKPGVSVSTTAVETNGFRQPMMPLLRRSEKGF